MPAFDEADNLPETVRGLVHELERLGLPWEVIVVDDGSRDGTTDALRPWLASPGLRCLKLSRNFGKEAALTAGIEHAQGDVVLVMDADGQHPDRRVVEALKALPERNRFMKDLGVLPVERPGLVRECTDSLTCPARSCVACTST